MTDNQYRVVRIRGQGLGTMSPERWAATPEVFRERVEVLELVPDQESATARYRQLARATEDGKWQDKLDLCKTRGKWWQDIGEIADGMRLFVPADEPIPIIHM